MIKWNNTKNEVGYKNVKEPAQGKYEGDRRKPKCQTFWQGSRLKVATLQKRKHLSETAKTRPLGDIAE